MSKWIAEFELEDGDTMPEHMDLEYKGVKIDFHCRPLSSSGNPNKSIEEKCLCYSCEHFKIKGWSHCKIHEDAYGDSRCSDYRKANQDSNKLEIPTGSTTKNDLPHCQHTDAEIAKSFIEDVEAVKDQLPCGEQMDFPNTFDEFAKDYGFKDKDEICTNGIELIPVYRVKQWLEHITPIRPKGHWYIDERPESDREVICSNCEQSVFKYHKIDFDYRPKYCPNCGAEMR